MSTTPNMGLTEPSVLVTTGPTYGTNQNSSFTLVDAHDHSTGKGVKISQTGLLFTGDVSYQNGNSYYGPTNLAYAQFHGQALQGAGTKTNSLMVDASGNLYFQNSGGTNVQITSSGTIVPNGTGTANGFYGDYSTAVTGGSAYYATSGNTYTFGVINGTSLPTTLSNVTGLKYTTKSNGTSGGLVTVSSANTNGWQLHNNSGGSTTGFQLDFNPTAGTRVNGSLLIIPNGGGSTPGQYWFGLNTNTMVGGQPACVTHFGNMTEQNNAVAAYAYYDQRTSTGAGDPAAGWGQQYIWRLAAVKNPSSVSFATVYAASLVTVDWKTVTTVGPAGVGRYRRYGSQVSGVDATAAIEIIGGGPAVGIGTTASVTYPLSVGATAGASANLTGSLTVAAGGITVTSGSLLLSSGNATLTSGTLTITSGNLTLSSGNASITGTLTATGATTLASSGGNVSIAAGGGTVTVNGAATLTSTLSVTGTVALATGGGTSTAGGVFGITPSGSAVSPTLYINTTNTGIYSPATHQLGFSTNGVVALTLDASQNATIAGALTVASGGISTTGGLTAVSGNVSAGSGGLVGATVQLSNVTNALNANVYNTFSVCSNYVTFSAAGAIATQWNITSVAALGAGAYTINFPRTLNANSCIGYCSTDAFVTVKITGGGPGSTSVSIATSDATNHAISLWVIGG